MEPEIGECEEILHEMECEEVDQIMEDLEISREDAQGVIRVREITEQAKEFNQQLFLCV